MQGRKLLCCSRELEYGSVSVFPAEARIIAAKSRCTVQIAGLVYRQVTGIAAVRPPGEAVESTKFAFRTELEYGSAAAVATVCVVGTTYDCGPVQVASRVHHKIAGLLVGTTFRTLRETIQNAFCVSLRQRVAGIIHSQCQQRDSQ